MASFLICTRSTGPNDRGSQTLTLNCDSNATSTLCLLVRGSLTYCLMVFTYRWNVERTSFSPLPSKFLFPPSPLPKPLTVESLICNVKTAHLPTDSQGQRAVRTAAQGPSLGRAYRVILVLLRIPQLEGLPPPSRPPLSAWTIAKKICPAVSLILYSYFHLFFILQDVNESV